MHIADMTLFYAPASGGVRTYLDAKHQRLPLRPGVRHSLLVPGSASTHVNGIYRVPAPSLPFANGYRFPLRLAPWKNALRDLQPDLIEVGDPYLTAWAALDARRQLNVPVIGFYHADLPALASNRIGAWLGSNVESYVARLYRHFDRVLAPTAIMAEKLEYLGVRNVFVQPLGVDLKAFNPGHRDPGLKTQLGLAEETRLLIFAGRGSREKNLPVLLDCMNLLGMSYHLLLVGTHMPASVPDNVSLIDFCPAAEVARLLASADVLLHAGDQESFGLVALEAMASGTPVVAVDAGAFSETIAPDCGVLCAAHDAQSMADAVRQVFANDIASAGRAARQHAEQYYGWDGVVDTLLEHYRAVLGVESAVYAHG